MSSGVHFCCEPPEDVSFGAAETEPLIASISGDAAARAGIQSRRSVAPFWLFILWGHLGTTLGRWAHLPRCCPLAPMDMRFATVPRRTDRMGHSLAGSSRMRRNCRTTLVVPTVSQCPLLPTSPSRCSALHSRSLWLLPCPLRRQVDSQPHSPPAQSLLGPPVHPQLIRQTWGQAAFRPSARQVPARTARKSQPPTPANFPGLYHMLSTGFESSGLSTGGWGGRSVTGGLGSERAPLTSVA